MGSFKAKLAKAAKLWGQAAKKKPDFGSELPDGTYHARIVKAELGESQAKGRLQVSWRAVVLNGEQKGENANWWSGLETEDQMMYFQRDLVRLGKEVPEDPSELGTVLKQLEKEKPAVRITVKTSGEFTNIRIGKLLEADDVGEEEEESETPSPEPVAEPEPAEEPVEEPEAEPEPEPAEEPEPEPEPEEDPTVDVGMRVMFTLKGKDTAGTVTALPTDENDTKVTVKTDAGPKYKIEVDKLRPAPKAKVTKKK